MGDTEDNNKALIEKRKRLIDVLIWRTYRASPDELLIEDDAELIEILLDEIRTPTEGRLDAFAPVLVNILQAHRDLLGNPPEEAKGA